MAPALAPFKSTSTLNRTSAFNFPFAFFFVVVVSSLSLLAAVVAAEDQNQAPAEYTDASAFKDAVLNGTNTYRRQHNATGLVWNSTLEAFAEAWGDDCRFGHSGGPYGENLASGYPNASASIVAWGHEREEYDFNKGDFSKQTGHFTQLVWKATTSVGCSRTRCDKHDSGGAPGWYVVCEYWPRGNVIGAFTENVQEQVNEEEAPGPGPQGPGQEAPADEKPKGEECMQGAVCSVAGRTAKGVGMAMWVGGAAWAVVWSWG
ncbi:PR-1-like protein [Melanomma pulvis-pyrius CBS 109.77]|uniref:PR-1-like protein n=1 Tax=Melanomma pulvis-pyrius CBS 109.77 TaxID=1314802 RepID=A0A6A6WXD4_9PLEO|nr:PR-1-like protein [Melanomma pulvis-pyrius CBS 109.77]